jgi:glutamine amidotransferase PdxT
MSRLCDRYELARPQTLVDNDFPMLGTCAGLIFLAKHLEGASENFAQTTLGASMPQLRATLTARNSIRLKPICNLPL